jgi:hypothetical protein
MSALRAGLGPPLTIDESQTLGSGTTLHTQLDLPPDLAVDNYHSLSVHQKAQFSILSKTSIFNSESLPCRFLTMSAATLATALIYISSALLMNLA